MALPLMVVLNYQETQLRNQGFNIFPVQFRDELNVDPFRASGLALVMIGAVTKTTFLEGFGHGLYAGLGLGTPLGQSGKLGNLVTGEEHSRTVGTTGHASAATDAFGGVHGIFGVGLANHH